MRGITEESTALGCAILATIGLGIYDSFDAAEKEMIKIKEKKQPIADNTKKYEKIYEINKKICDLFIKEKINEEIAKLS